MSVAQPLRVESGSFTALLPTSDEYGILHLAYEPREISAEPSGRELETSLSYGLWRGGDMSAVVELRHRSEPGHTAGAPDETLGRIGLRKMF
jgi:hypothetical protein